MCKKSGSTYVVLLISAIFLLCFRPEVGHAQEPVPTETPYLENETPYLENTATPVNAETAAITETATPVENEEPIAPSPENQPTTRLLIKTSRNARLANIMSRMSEQGQVIESDELGTLGIFILEVSTEQLDEKILQLRNASGVSWVELDYPVQALETIPNDPSFPSQYALTAIRAPKGWDISTGSPSIIIAILDSGVDLSHPELAGRIMQGYDFVNNDPTPQDDYGHGTHVAGIAGASANNGMGIAGVSWGAGIMPVKVLNASGGGSFSNVAAGIIWATDHGAQIINLSLGGANYSQTLENAVIYAANHGVLLIAASGNTNANTVLYPARFSQVMAVAATNAANQRASFSNYGDEIEIAAPGDTILSLWPGGGYNTFSGTSMAAPYVSGLASILLGYESNSSLVRDRLKESALDISPAGYDIYTGAGLIQMDAALRLMLPTPDPGDGVNENPLVNFPPSLPTLTSVWTQTPPATLTSVPVTPSTASPITATITPQPLPSNMIVSTLTPDLQALGEKYDFASPLFCGGIIFILLGGLLLFFFTRKAPTRFNSMNAGK